MNGRPSRDAFSGVGNKCTKTQGQKHRGRGKKKPPPLSGAEGYLFFEFLVFLVEPGNVAQFSEQATSLRSLLINLSQRLLVVLFVNIYLLSDRKQVEHEIVKIQAGWEAIEEKCHHQRHHPHHGFLPWVFHRHFLLNERRDTHERGQPAYLLNSEKRNSKRKHHNHVRNRKIGYPPEESGLAEFDGGAENVVKSDQNRKLQQHGQATAGGVDPVFLVETHDLLIHLLRIVFVFRPYLIHHRLKRLHSLPRLHTGLGQRMEGYFDNNRKNY